MMTRKHYIRLAEALCAARPGVGGPPAAFTQWFYDVDTIANVLAEDNPKFDYVRFNVACGRF